MCAISHLHIMAPNSAAPSTLPSTLFQNAGVMTDQRIGYSWRFTLKPLLQPRAKPMAEGARTLLEESFRQIDPAIL